MSSFLPSRLSKWFGQRRSLFPTAKPFRDRRSDEMPRKPRFTWARAALGTGLLVLLGTTYWKFAIPTHRTGIHSELVMLGDLDGDNLWGAGDLAAMDKLQQHPFTWDAAQIARLDCNQNSSIDSEDILILHRLVAAQGDPYRAHDSARSEGVFFPYPRELYRFVPTSAYQPRPLWALPYAGADSSILTWLASLRPNAARSNYGEELAAEIYSEAVRLDQAWRARQANLQPAEQEYLVKKLQHLQLLRATGDQFGLLLALMDLVEDGETLTTRDQPPFPLKLLAFRDHLRALLESHEYAEFEAGNQDWRTVLAMVSRDLKSDLDLDYDFQTLGPPRNLTNFGNYLQRAQWQYYKTTTTEDHFRSLILFAQHDPRYLRAASRTSPKLHDTTVENHNLPMILLFREALRLTHGDKKRAIGLLDESIRIPFTWIKSIPRQALPGSLAMDNFLLPGNKEDGADKSRHWNVFGGICIYKSPQEALDLALKREMKDLREDGYSKASMREFLRDMIANLNGMYHVMTVNPALIAGPQDSDN